jgi:hypothetical protein
VKVQGKGGEAETWLFQALTARQLGKHDEALALLERVETWHGKQTMSDWRQRVFWDVLLREARTVVRTPPAMRRVPPGE